MKFTVLRTWVKIIKAEITITGVSDWGIDFNMNLKMQT